MDQTSQQTLSPLPPPVVCSSQMEQHGNRASYPVIIHQTQPQIQAIPRELQRELAIAQYIIYQHQLRSAHDQHSIGHLQALLETEVRDNQLSRNQLGFKQNMIDAHKENIKLKDIAFIRIEERLRMVEWELKGKDQKINELKGIIQMNEKIVETLKKYKRAFEEEEIKLRRAEREQQAQVEKMEGLNSTNASHPNQAELMEERIKQAGKARNLATLDKSALTEEYMEDTNESKGKINLLEDLTDSNLMAKAMETRIKNCVVNEKRLVQKYKDLQIQLEEDRKDQKTTVLALEDEIVVLRQENERLTRNNSKVQGSQGFVRDLKKRIDLLKHQNEKLQMKARDVRGFDARATNLQESVISQLMERLRAVDQFPASYELHEEHRRLLYDLEHMKTSNEAMQRSFREETKGLHEPGDSTEEKIHELERIRLRRMNELIELENNVEELQVAAEMERSMSLEKERHFLTEIRKLSDKRSLSNAHESLTKELNSGTTSNQEKIQPLQAELKSLEATKHDMLERSGAEKADAEEMGMVLEAKVEELKSNATVSAGETGQSL